MASARFVMPSRARRAFVRTVVAVTAIAVVATSSPAFAGSADPGGTSKTGYADLPKAKPPAPMERGENVAGGPVRSRADAAAYRRSAPPVPSREAHPTRLTAPDESSAKAMAEREREAVEVTDLRTETTSVLAQPDGTMTLQSYAAPVRLRDGNGWRDVDTSLMFDGDVVRPRGAKANVRFSAGGPGEAASLGTAQHRFAVDWPTPLPVPTLDGDTATYRNVMPGTDLTLQATRMGYEQHLVVHEAPSRPIVVRMPVKLRGLELRQLAGGELVLADERGRRVAQATRPEMWGAAVDPRSGEPTERATVATRILREHGQTVIELRPDPAFLARATYPITIDPDQSLTNTGDSWIMTSYSNTSQIGSTELKSGTYDGGAHIARSLLKFSTSPVTGKDVLSATLKLYNHHSFSCGTSAPRRTDVNMLTSAWDSATTWTNRPAFTTTAQAYSTFAYGYSTCADGWATWTNMGPMVQRWADGTNTNHGVIVMANDEGDSYAWRRYYSANNGSNVPSLSVSYNSYPKTPTSLSPASGSTVSTLTPTLSAIASDPDGGTVRAMFDLYTNSGTAIVTAGWGTAVTSGQRSTYTVPTGKLAYNTTYKWRVRVRDTAHLYSAYAPSSGYYTFTTSSTKTKPTPPGVDVVAGDGNATVTWTPPADDGGADVTAYKVYVYPNACVSAPSSTTAFKSYSPALGTWSQAVTGLTNGTAYCFHVTATNSVGTSNPGTELATPHGLAQIVKTVAGDKGVAQPLYAYGQTLTYTVTVTNPETSGTMAGVRFTDAVPDALTLEPEGVWLNGADCSVTTTCLLTGNTFDFTLPTLNAGQSATVTYQASIPRNDTLDCVATLVNTATATNAAGTASATKSVDACNSGLGTEPWWSYVTTPAGPQANAMVNVANGNLVVSATDATPVQAHGRLALVLRRTYNSREATLATLPGSLGAGWHFNVGQSDDLAADGVGTTGLYVPSAEAITSPLSVAMIDRDGTRHLFAPDSVGVDVNGVGVSTALRPARLALDSGFTRICIDQTYDAPPGVHLGLWRYVETTQSSCSGLVNETTRLLGFAAVRPDRVRYEWSANGRLLSMLDGAGNRLDYVYDNAPTGVVTGALSGIDLELGNLRAVYEPRACTVPAPVTVDSIPDKCRALRFYYPSPTEMVVYDGATRQRWPEIPAEGPPPTVGRAPTRYYFDTPAPGQPKHLVMVMNPADSDNDVRAVSVTPSANPARGDRVHYTYGGCAGANAHQLCSVSSQRDKEVTTSFTYTSPGTLVAGEMPKVASFKDRRDTVTTFTYSSGTTVVDAHAGNGAATHRRTYAEIDPKGRVGHLAEGDASGSGTSTIGRTYFTWDGGDANVTCQQPGGGEDNNLCLVQRESGTPATPDEETSFLYNDEGARLAEHRCLSAEIASPHVDACVAPSASVLSTTSGYSALYYRSDGTVSTPYVDSVAGGGNVTPGALRPITGTLFALSDRAESLTPRGNEGANTATMARYKTTYVVDNVATAAPNNALASGTICTATGTATGNSGLVCSTLSPNAAVIQPGGTYSAALTRYRFDRFGHRTEMALPNMEGTTNAYKYEYYAEQSDTDLSGVVYSGGWLRTVTDPAFRYVYFVYDAAGNVVRTYDRDATRGRSLTSFTGAGWTGAAPGPAYAETLYGPAPGADPGATAESAPWRYELSSTNQENNRTTYVVDQHGNRERTTPPRGNTPPVSASYDVVQEFWPDDRLRHVRMPVAAPLGKKTTTTYDPFGNVSVVTDPEGHLRSYDYDAKNRLVAANVARGLAATTAVPGGCFNSSSAPATGIPAGTVYCKTTRAYDMVDNAVSTTDAAGQTTVHDFDGVHREIRTDAPGHTSPAAALVTRTIYDADGRPVVVCPPRQSSEGGPCVADGVTPPSYFSTYTTYDNAGHVASTKRYNSANATDTAVTTHEYDKTGNEVATTDPRGVRTTVTYDSRDRRSTRTVPRTVDSSGTVTEAYTTTWGYSEAGDLLMVLEPGSPSDNPGVTASNQTRITAYSYDAAHRHVDTVRGLQLSSGNPASSVAAGGAPGYVATIASATAGTSTNQRVRKVYDADGHVTRVYEPRAFTNGGTTSAPLADFSVVTEYDNDGRSVEQFVPRSSSSAGVSDTTQCAPDTKTDSYYPAGTFVCRTKVEYDAAGRVTKVHMPTRTATKTNRYVEYTYSDDGLMLTLKGPDPASDGTRDVLDTRTYDGAGRLLTDKNALNQVATTVYWPDGRVREVHNPTAVGLPAHQVRHEYDANGNETKTVRPRTAPGTLATENLAVTRTYTPRDQLVTHTTDGPGTFGTDFAVTSYTYDRSGNTLSVKSPSANAGDASNAGTATFHTYTADNLLKTTTEPVESDGSVRRRTTYEYDPGGRKTSVATDLVNASGATVPPAGPSPQVFTYTALDQVKTEQGRGGVDCITRTYDAAGNPVTQSDAAGVPCGTSTTARTISATFHNDGLLATATTGDRLAKFAYDGAGAVTQRAMGLNGFTATDLTTYTRNDAGLPAKTVTAYAAGETNVTYNSLGQPVGRSDPNGQSVRWQYAGDGTLTEMGITSPGGTPDDTALYSYTYDEHYRKLTQTYTGKDASALHLTVPPTTYTFEYNPAGNVKSFTSSAVGATPVTATWDHNANRLTYGPRTFTYRADNSIKTGPSGTSNTPRDHHYDVAGRLTSDGCTTYGYDGFDRLTSSAGAGGLDCGSATATYLYDPLDRQVTKTSSAPNQSAVTTRLFYSGFSSAVGSEIIHTNRNDYGLDADGAPFVVRQTAGSAVTTQFLADDGTGSVATVTDGSGAVVCTARYDAFGSPAGNSAATPAASCNSGSTVGTVFYRGMRKDEQTGNYQMGSRTYDPAKATFLMPDTYRSTAPSDNLSIGSDPLTANRFGYVNGDPVNLVDPTGHGPACDDDPDRCAKVRDRATKATYKRMVNEWSASHLIQIMSKRLKQQGKEEAEIRRELDAKQKLAVRTWQRVSRGEAIPYWLLPYAHLGGSLLGVVNADEGFGQFILDSLVTLGVPWRAAVKGLAKAAERIYNSSELEMAARNEKDAEGFKSVLGGMTVHLTDDPSMFNGKGLPLARMGKDGRIVWSHSANVDRDTLTNSTVGIDIHATDIEDALSWAIASGQKFRFLAKGSVDPSVHRLFDYYGPGFSMTLRPAQLIPATL